MTIQCSDSKKDNNKSLLFNINKSFLAETQKGIILGSKMEKIDR